MTPSRRPVETHGDPGLQPERTSLAWGRTMMALATVSAIILRWLPHHGFPILLLFGVAIAAAAAIYFTQRQRYRSNCNGISREGIYAHITAVASTAFAAVTLGALGIGIVLTAN